jgi:OmpR-family two-component system manganese-sensing response regulator
LGRKVNVRQRKDRPKAFHPVTLDLSTEPSLAMAQQTKARILHVDDHQDTRLMMAALLQDCGYGVMTAGSVAEGLELAKEINFDLYILDVRLPDGTGVELCQKLRALRPHVPILYYSAYGNEEDHQTALAACGDAYLKKPVSIAEIESLIAKLLAGPEK